MKTFCLSRQSKSVLGCPDGFCGSNYSTQCPYPTYGEQWNHTCNRTEELCNHVTGCFQHQDMMYFSYLKNNDVNTFKRN